MWPLFWSSLRTFLSQMARPAEGSPVALRKLSDSSDDFSHFFKTGFGHLQGILRPIVAIEQLERKYFRALHVFEVGQYFGQRGDSIARVNTVLVFKVFACDGSGIIV